MTNHTSYGRVETVKRLFRPFVSHTVGDTPPKSWVTYFLSRLAYNTESDWDMIGVLKFDFEIIETHIRVEL